MHTCALVLADGNYVRGAKLPVLPECQACRHVA
jgi:hypothetical protein